MNELFLIVVLVLVIALVGDNNGVRSICSIAILLVAMSARMPQKKEPTVPAEPFTVISEKPNAIEFADYSNYVQTNPNLRLLNDRMALDEIKRGGHAAQINRGAQKSRVDYMRPFFEDEFSRNSTVDWWNNERTFKYI